MDKETKQIVQDGKDEWGLVKSKKGYLKTITDVEERKDVLAEFTKCSTCPIGSVCPSCDMNDRGCALRYNAYVNWIKNSKDCSKEVTEIEDLYGLMKGQLAVEQLKMIKDGKLNSRTFMEMMKDMIEALTVLHKIKYGTKTTIDVQKTITLQDIRAKMFDINEAISTIEVTEVPPLIENKVIEEEALKQFLDEESEKKKVN